MIINIIMNIIIPKHNITYHLVIVNKKNFCIQRNNKYRQQTVNRKQ